MKYEDFIKVISNDVSRILSENSTNILEHIVTNTSPSEYITEDHIKMCRNAVSASVHLSCQIIFDVLDSLGMLNYQNLSEHFEPPALEIIPGGLTDEPKD